MTALVREALSLRFTEKTDVVIFRAARAPVTVDDNKLVQTCHGHRVHRSSSVPLGPKTASDRSGLNALVDPKLHSVRTAPESSLLLCSRPHLCLPLQHETGCSKHLGKPLNRRSFWNLSCSCIFTALPDEILLFNVFTFLQTDELSSIAAVSSR
jgi:hypothetical protein